MDTIGKIEERNEWDWQITTLNNRAGREKLVREANALSQFPNIWNKKIGVKSQEPRWRSERVVNTSFYDTQFYRIKGRDARGAPPSPVIFEMTKLTPENYISLESQKPNLPQGVLAMFAYEGVRAMFLGLKFHLKVISGSKICNMNFLFLGGKIFSNCHIFLDSFL